MINKRFEKQPTVYYWDFSLCVGIQEKMHISYSAALSYHWSYIVLLHSSPGEFDISSLLECESSRREMGQFEAKSAEAIILIPRELSSDQDIFLLSPWFCFTWEYLDADRLVQGKPGNHWMRPHFILQPQVLISHVTEGQSGEETSGCISRQKFPHCYPHGLLSPLSCWNVQNWLQIKIALFLIFKNKHRIFGQENVKRLGTKLREKTTAERF